MKNLGSTYIDIHIFINVAELHITVASILFEVLDQFLNINIDQSV